MSARNRRIEEAIRVLGIARDEVRRLAQKQDCVFENACRKVGIDYENGVVFDHVFHNTTSDKKLKQVLKEELR